MLPVMNAMPHNPHRPSRRDVLRLDALGLLSEFAGDLVGIEDPDALLWAVAERTISKLGWMDCVIYLRDPHRDILIQKAAFGPKSIDYKAIFQPIEIPMGRGIVGRVASTGESIRVADTSRFIDYITDDASRLSELAVPICWGDHILGVIDSEHPDPDFYTIEDQLILETIAGITATKIQNAASARSNQALALFYERNPNAVLQIDASRTISFINQSAQMCFPEHPECGNTLNRPGLEEALQTALEKGRATWRCTQSYPETGKTRTGEFQVVHLPSGQFNLYGNDITHLLDLQKAAEAANEAKSRFLSVMSHEIRTPLNAILGLTDLLIHDDPNREEQLRHLAYMEFSGRHLLSLVNDILDLEKMASGKTTSLTSEFNFHDLISNIMDSFRNRAERVGLELTLSMGSTVPEKLVTDAKWITQILNNLISNSIKYTDQGHVTLRIEWEDPIASDLKREMLRMQVTDTGRGIDKKEQDRILKPFEQIENDANIEGTGLGLAIVKSIVDQMKGSLSILSAKGEGSTFTVELPMEAAQSTARGPWNPGTGAGEHDEPHDLPTEAQNPQEDHAPDKKAGPTCPILLTDDNELNRFVASKLLSRWGFEVIEAKDGLEAIDAWEDQGPCIILMDVQMPKMDGIEATRHIRYEEEKQGMLQSPIIALTADAEEKTLERILACGMDDRIVKPFDPPALRGIIERVMAQFKTTLS